MVATDATPSIPGYRIEGIAGRGGMGIVYVATQLYLGRRVALKVLDRRYAHDPAFRERFLRESRIAASLEHPSIVPIFDAGAHGELLYLAMRFLSGGDLATAIRRHGPLAPDVVVRLVTPIAAALDAAHRRELIHRDVKPGNILLDDGALEGRGTTYLGDFGITRRADGTSALTEPGQFIGTIEYAAPEQLRGMASAASDQYALGCIVFECLSGRRPFGGSTPAQVIQEQLEAPVPRLATLREDLGTELEAPLQRALAKAAADRFESCRAFVDALGAAAARPHRPVPRPVPVPPSNGSPSRLGGVDPLSQRVAALCDAALGRLPPGAARDLVAATRMEVAEPLRIVVAGRVKAGKSTLVNALLRERVAATDASECTRVVTVYRHGPTRSVEIRPRKGGPRMVPLRQDADGNTEIDLGEEPSAIDSVIIRLPSDVLRSMTLIDTPGLASLDERSAGAARDMLAVDADSRVAPSSADALVFLLPGQPTADDIEVIRAFRARYESLEHAVDNAVGVLSRADQLGGEGDPWEHATRRAEALGNQLSDFLATVIPAVGLLAESADHVRESDAAVLRELAAAIPAAERQWTLVDAEAFLEADLSVARPARQRLVGLLGLYGLARALDAIDLGIDTAVTIGKHLEEISGVHALRHLLFMTFASRADILRAQSALAALELLVHSPNAYDASDARLAAELAWLGDSLEQLQLEPTMHRLAELQAGRLLAAGGTGMPPELASDVERILEGVSSAWRLGLPEDATGDEIRAAAASHHQRWRSFLADPATAPELRRLAHVFARSYAIAAA